MSQFSPVETHYCPECNFESTTENGILTHSRSFHVGTLCLWEGCGVRTPTEKQLRTHITKTHTPVRLTFGTKKDGTMDPRYACSWPNCNKSFVEYQGTSRCAYTHVYDVKMAIEARNVEQNRGIQMDIDGFNPNINTTHHAGEISRFRPPRPSERESRSYGAATNVQLLQVMNAISTDMSDLFMELREGIREVNDKLDQANERLDDIELIVHELNGAEIERMQGITQDEPRRTAVRPMAPQHPSSRQ